MEPPQIRRSRASSSDSAREYRARGHKDALEFAQAIGLPSDYKNDPIAKKDVIDQSGEAHTVKSGDKKWQIFLYGKGRFETDNAFKVMNGIGALLITCLDAFPPTYEEYKANKNEAKQKLRIAMRALAERLQSRDRLKAFLEKAIFNGHEATYLTIKQDNVFHVYWNKDIIDLLGNKLEVTNSKAISQGQVPEQKVLFRFDGKNLGELEMRNDSPIHYREIRFNMIKPKVLALLAQIPLTSKFSNKVFVYGNASKHFARWTGAPKLTPV